MEIVGGTEASVAAYQPSHVQCWSSTETTKRGVERCYCLLGISCTPGRLLEAHIPAQQLNYINKNSSVPQSQQSTCQ